MAEKGGELDRETFSCSICLDLLKDPVTIPCGHSYCMNCIKSHFDKEKIKKNKNKKNIHRCPDCTQLFTTRPVLVKNTMLAVLVQQLKKTGLQAAPADHCYAGPEDVACDVCTGRKLKAFKSCLVCLASYCEKHLQPHYKSPTFKQHKLVDPSKKLQENICSRHGEVMKMFCRTDQQSICYLCPVDEHKGHDTVSAAAERTKRQKKVEVRRQNIQQMIQDKEKDVKLLQQELKAINGRVKEVQKKLEQEISELKREDVELKQLSDTEDHNQFLHNYPSLSSLSQSTHSSSINICPLRNFEDVKAAVTELRNILEDILRETRTNISLTVTEVDVLQPEPKTRKEFCRKYSCEITLDPNTLHRCLVLSVWDTTVTTVNRQRSYSHHPDRFTDCSQALSKKSLPGRCYWEVEWRGFGVGVAVAYKNISRGGKGSRFGLNDHSWTLDCYKDTCTFVYNDRNTFLSGRPSSRVGVYLDHRAGILSFYSVSETMTLLHRVQTTFTQPLYAGLRIDGRLDKSSAELINTWLCVM